MSVVSGLTELSRRVGKARLLERNVDTQSHQFEQHSPPGPSFQLPAGQCGSHSPRTGQQSEV
jgi:hypothetical protein